MNKFKLSIIIAHFCLDKKSLHFNSFIETLKTINKQFNNHKIEIIICDDGSIYSKNIMDDFSDCITIQNDKRKIYLLKNKPLKKWLDNNIEIDTSLITKWLYIPKIIPCMSKARLLNYATKLSESEYLFFLDDDNFFISNNSIDSILDLFKKYDIIFGQIKDNSNILRSYKSNRVQGTTFGLKKSLIEEIGYFGEWTEKISCGFDSDLWIKLFKYYNKTNNLKACYTNQISTLDSCSGRWKKYTNLFKEIGIRKKFMIEHNIKNYKNAKFNLSRNKKLWLENLIL